MNEVYLFLRWCVTPHAFCTFFRFFFFVVSFYPVFLKKWSFVHFILSSTLFSLRADLSCVSIWVVGLKSLQVSWKNRWLGRWEQESLFALLLPLASQLNPLVIGLWEDVCPSFRLLLLADLSLLQWGIFFTLVFQRKRWCHFLKFGCSPAVRGALRGCFALSQGFSLHWDWRCEI